MIGRRDAAGRRRTEAAAVLLHHRGEGGDAPAVGARGTGRREEDARAVEGAARVGPVHRADEPLVAERDLLPAGAQRDLAAAPRRDELQIALVQIEHVHGRRRSIRLRAEDAAVLQLEHHGEAAGRDRRARRSASAAA